MKRRWKRHQMGPAEAASAAARRQKPLAAWPRPAVSWCHPCGQAPRSTTAVAAAEAPPPVAAAKPTRIPPCESCRQEPRGSGSGGGGSCARGHDGWSCGGVGDPDCRSCCDACGGGGFGCGARWQRDRYLLWSCALGDPARQKRAPGCLGLQCFPACP
mmetsp:Transcript_57731/g.124846  ORF Transcript_57731/g.124846 Transcript_57731/m.124846 type:complete len:158 (+) Transcript_57731:216-689(+)